MKKTVAILTVVLMILGTMSSALAARPVCTVCGCTKTRSHTHGGKTYSAHHAEDGHYYHQCGLSGCTDASPHNHNDYFNDYNSGGGYQGGGRSNSGGYQGGHHSNFSGGSGHGSGHGRGGHH